MLIFTDILEYMQIAPYCAYMDLHLKQCQSPYGDVQWQEIIALFQRHSTGILNRVSFASTNSESFCFFTLLY